MPHIAPELWITIAMQLIGYGAVRQQVKNLVDAMQEEKIERKKIDERVRGLEVNFAQNFSMSKKAGV